MAAMHRVKRKPQRPNRWRRFSRKTDFGEHEETQSRRARKIFFLPKTETQSPRNALSAGIDRPRDVGSVSIVECASNENTCGTAASCKLTIAGVAFSRASRVVARKHRGAADQPASRVRASACQHFLKWDAVFYHVLVYSGCSAFRFPSARSNKAISLHQEGNMAKKAKKAKKAKSAVKKTAKKTRKVAKKKK
jgi:hypothetical protein